MTTACEQKFNTKAPAPGHEKSPVPAIPGRAPRRCAGMKKPANGRSQRTIPGEAYSRMLSEVPSLGRVPWMTWAFVS